MENNLIFLNSIWVVATKITIAEKLTKTNGATH